MPNEQTENTPEQTPSAPEPVDIAQAFKMVNEANRAAAEEPVAPGEAGQPDDEGEQPAGEGTEAPASEEGAAESVSDTTEDIGDNTDGNVGGSSAVIEPVDYSPRKQEILKNIQARAIEEVRKEMKEQGIELWTMNDIYERDENTGRATFRNPDDPNNPCKSRAEAQNFINAINSDIENHFRNEVNKKQQQLVQQSLPTLQMVDFANTYQAMSQIEKDVFDDLISPYALKDNRGNIVGFNVNLEAAANTARQIAKRFNMSQQAAPAQQDNKQQERKPPEQPALDIKTGNGVSPDEEEPKTIGEALKRFDEQNRKKKGK